MDNTRNPAWRRYAAYALAAAIAGAMLAVWIMGIPEINEDQIRRVAAENTALLLAVMLGVMVLQNLLTIIPLVAILSVNVALFGLAGGFLWSWLSSLAGASLAFAVARHGFQEFVQRRMKPGLLEKIAENGHMYVFLARLFPFAPSNLVNYAAGIGGISFRRYIAATAAGNFLFQLIVSLLVEGLLSEDAEFIVSIAVFAVMLAAVWAYGRYRRRRTNSKE